MLDKFMYFIIMW